MAERIHKTIGTVWFLHKLNAQIGRYLANNQKKLEICKNGGKEVCMAITGRLSPNQKWRLLFIPLLLLFMSISTYAQTLTPQQNKKSKWGYVNEAGKAVIKHKYDNARAFSDGLAAVNKGGYWGLINEAGKEVLKCKYNEVRYFSEEGVAIVRSRINVSNGVYANKFGVVDKTGSFIVPLEYDTIRDFSNGLAVVKGEIADDRSGYSHKKYIRWGIIDKAGALVQPLKYTEISEFSEGLLKAEEDNYGINRFHIIDKAGKIIATYKEISEFSEGLLKAEEYGRNRCHIIDKAGKIIAEYSIIGELSEGLARVRSGSSYKWGYIDKTGKVVIPVEYSRADDFSEGFAVVSSTDYPQYNWGVIDKTGTLILPVKHRREQSVGNSLSAFVQEEIQRKQEEEKKEAEINTLIEEVEVVLDNDYYSANCHPVDVLKNIEAQVDQTLDAIFNGDMKYYMDKNIDNVKYLQQLKTGLSNAIKAQQMTKKYGAATAKKIIAGKYEIGMTKAVVEEIMGVKKALYKISSTAQSEIWQFDINNPKLYYYSANDKLMLKSQLPTLVFRGGKLTDIYR